MKVYLTIDIGGTFTKFGIFSEKEELLLKWKTLTNTTDNKQIYHEVSKELLDKINYNNYTPLSLAVGIPGFPDKKGKVILSGNIGWKNYKIKKDLQEYFKIPIIVHNDVDMHTLGERYIGAGQKISNFVVLALGTGLGSGIFINDKLYVGNSGFAGEVGHIPIQNIAKCTCGLPNCAEPTFSAQGLIFFFNKHLKNNKIDEHNLADINGEYIISLAKKGDKIAIDSLRELSKYGGKVLATIALILNPEKIILSGGITTGNNILLKMVKKEYKKLVHDFIYESTTIELSNTGGDTALYGCLYSSKCLLEEGYK